MDNKVNPPDSMDNRMRLFNAIKDAVNEMDRCPADSIQDIWNEILDQWKTGLRMDIHHNIETKSTGGTAPDELQAISDVIPEGYKLAKKTTQDHIAFMADRLYAFQAILKEILAESKELRKSFQKLFEEAEQSQKEAFRLRTAIIDTLAENAHLADGEQCTLIRLKKALEPEG